MFHLIRCIPQKLPSSIFLQSSTSILRCLSTQSVNISRQFTVTTPIYYVNGAPHIGHIYSNVLADCISRWHRQKGDHVLFTTGTDEHGSKIQKESQNSGESIVDYTNKISSEFQKSFKHFNISYDDFIRTTEKRHEMVCDYVWNQMVSRGDIYKGEYEGWYCRSDESFLTEKQTTVDNNIRISLESGHPVEWISEYNYVFKLSKYQNQILEFLQNNPSFITPKSRYNEVVEMLQSPLPDLSVSRPAARVPWGISVPGDSSQTMYVWIDALCNYLTTSTTNINTNNKNNNTNTNTNNNNEIVPDFKLWPASIQIFGKDILKFHSIYWLAFLSSLSLPFPSRQICHSHWTVNNSKISKSRKNYIPLDVLNKYITPEMFRYYFMTENCIDKDADIQLSRLSSVINGQLADNYGNLLLRCTNNKITKYIQSTSSISSIPHAMPNENRERIVQMAKNVTECFDDCCFHSGIDLINQHLKYLNKIFHENEPWKLVKQINNNPDILDKLNTLLYEVYEGLRVSSILLSPIIPQTSELVLKQLGIDAQYMQLDSVYSMKNDIAYNNIQNTKIVLFPKVDFNGNEELKTFL
ncbi:hypothetical protein WA158_003437 [Blastocystis sp. Blastoise]